MSKNNATDPFVGLILDNEEQELEAALESKKFEKAHNLRGTQKILEEATKQYRQLHTAKPITLRINQMDLIKIKAKAKRNNIPYQTLVGAVLHDFAEGKKDLTIK